MCGAGISFLEKILHGGQLHVRLEGKDFLLHGPKEGNVSLYSYVREAVIRYRHRQIDCGEREILRNGVLSWTYVPTYPSEVVIPSLMVHLGGKAKDLLTDV